MSISILRTGNCLTLTGGGPYLASMLDGELTYTQKVMYRGQMLRKRQNTLDQMRLQGDPRAATFRPQIDFFRMQAYEMTTTGELRCPSGLYSRIYKVLTANQVPFTYTDRRSTRLPPADFSRLVGAGLTDLRYRQDAVLAAIDGNEGGIILAPTGFGKSLLAKCCCAIYPKNRILFVTPGVDTVNSVYTSLKELFPMDVGEVSGRRSQTDKRITVASVDSLHKVDMNWYDLILGDECHDFATPKALQHFTRFTEAKMIGFTASFPCRSDGADLLVEAIFGPPLIEVEYHEAVAGKSVVPIEVLVLDIPPINGYNNTRDGDAWLRWAYWRNDARNRIYADFLNTQLKDYVSDPDPQVLCMVDKIEHLVMARKYLPNYTAVYNTPANGDDWLERVNSWRQKKLWNDNDPVMTPRMRETYRLAFEAGTLRRAISTHVWKQGVNFQQLSVLARMDGIVSEIDSIQLPGRLSRLYDGKQVGYLLDSRDRYDEKADRRSLQRFRSYRSRGWVVRELSPHRNESTLFQD